MRRRLAVSWAILARNHSATLYNAKAQKGDQVGGGGQLSPAQKVGTHNCTVGNLVGQTKRAGLNLADNRSR